MADHWVETSAVLEKQLWELHDKTHWFSKQAQKVLDKESVLQFLHEQPHPVAIMTQVVQESLHSEGLGLEELRKKDQKRTQWSLHTPRVFMLWDSPYVEVFDLNGRSVFHGVLQPSDQSLILNFSVNHFFVIMDG